MCKSFAYLHTGRSCIILFVDGTTVTLCTPLVLVVPLTGRPDKRASDGKGALGSIVGATVLLVVAWLDIPHKRGRLPVPRHQRTQKRHELSCTVLRVSRAIAPTSCRSTKILRLVGSYEAAHRSLLVAPKRTDCRSNSRSPSNVQRAARLARSNQIFSPTLMQAGEHILTVSTS